MNVTEMLATIDQHMTLMYAANAAEPYDHNAYMLHQDSVLAGLFLLTGDHEASRIIFDHMQDSFSEPDYVGRMVALYMSDAAHEVRSQAEAERLDAQCKRVTGFCDWCELPAAWIVRESGWHDYACEMHRIMWASTYGPAATTEPASHLPETRPIRPY